MDPRFRVQVATGLDQNLSNKQLAFVKGLKILVVDAGFRVTSQAGSSFTLDARYSRICRCDGVLVVAFSQWKAFRLFRKKNRKRVFPTEFVHINNAMSVAAGKPLLVFREKNVDERGSLRPNSLPALVGRSCLDESFSRATIPMPVNKGPDWLNSRDFIEAFQSWVSAVQRRKHVFLAYSSKASEIAKSIAEVITKRIGLSVLDWHTFLPGENIYDCIEKAERSTSCGVFLFTADDELKTDSGQRAFVPSDNVLLEFAFFAGIKGKGLSLILKEKNVVMPSDLGGVLFTDLPDRSDLTSIEGPLRHYFERVFPSEDNQTPLAKESHPGNGADLIL